MNFLLDKKFLWFVTKFLLLFTICYYGTLAIIGLSAPGGYYSPFVEKYLDYVSWIKRLIVAAVGGILSLFDIETRTEPGFLIRIVNKRGVIIAMNCVGYAVYSFWIAYVVANTGSVIKKLLWATGGVWLLWFINVIRITLFLVAINKGWAMPLGLDHHTWFNIVAYGFIFLMMYFYNKQNQLTADE